ncbi:hypothetical protein SUGI_0586860 [Cryptomeria japonica]|uniref:uncharacterized protein LOC131064217 isoform X1 n=1 Tax=Cryptomeria japonica TaxID=3369 RepID=UPI002414C5DD|nr:uncharacterized protein LOC131064217 isoform X1 [Cryptomeria japonica]GLJ29740.1 hypothetical protein SUGI_0586860 [Cryptomeria japonica]
MDSMSGLYRLSGILSAKGGSIWRNMSSIAARYAIRKADEEMTCVLYHYPCNDGAFAALAAHLYHSLLALPVVFVPNSTNDPLRAEDFACKKFHTCYLLDFIGPNEFATKLSQIVNQVVVIDHHKTALDYLQPIEGCDSNIISVIDMKKSSATIAYDYFTQKLGHANQIEQCRRTLVAGQNLDRVELLFRYVEDADLWRWSLPDSKAFNAGLNTKRPNINAIFNPYMFNQLLTLDPATLIAYGNLQLENREKLVQNLLNKAFKLNLGGGRFGKCLAVRADEHVNLRSELGNNLSVKSAIECLRPIGAVIYEHGGKLKISLRSTDDSIDTTEISRAYGGGGHPGASSFFISREEYGEWMLDNLLDICNDI